MKNLFLRFFIFNIIIILLLTNCRLYQIKLKDFEGNYISSVLPGDTLSIVYLEQKGKLFYYRKYKDFSNTGEIDLEKFVLYFYNWSYHGESEKNKFEESNSKITFISTWETVDDTIYIYQIDANADIIEKYYYKKISQNINSEVKDIIKKMDTLQFRFLGPDDPLK
ncbi:MAG: hypothetical protein KatS3mg034_2152 [Vicingaceae bacterium]|nr:MAG: hypothetical protein KatS3mg034_2152 [Vicingaceae bacterium]